MVKYTIFVKLTYFLVLVFELYGILQIKALLIWAKRLSFFHFILRPCRPQKMMRIDVLCYTHSSCENRNKIQRVRVFFSDV